MKIVRTGNSALVKLGDAELPRGGHQDQMRGMEADYGIEFPVFFFFFFGCLRKALLNQLSVSMETQQQSGGHVTTPANTRRWWR